MWTYAKCSIHGDMHFATSWLLHLQLHGENDSGALSEILEIDVDLLKTRSSSRSAIAASLPK